ncbi:MAG: GNAT family N-acetyltransferase [Hominenteromicrobium sp.]
MLITDFLPEHIPAAQALVLANYMEERAAVPALPEVCALPDFDAFVKNGLGAAAFENGELAGFLCVYDPWCPAFWTPDTTGVFSPLHGHAAKKENRVRIYRRLYQAAAEKWVKAGAASHALALCAHDTDGERAFFTYGFGLRCMDAIRAVTPLGIPAPADMTLTELPRARVHEIAPLRRALSAHLGQSPCFMYDPPEEIESQIAKAETRDSRLFAAEQNGVPKAFLEIRVGGENFATYAPNLLNICGAYCMPDLRGTGTMQALLDFLLCTLQSEGITRLGVDFESINPTALGFWTKYFGVYTHGLVRRIDENALNR